MNSCSKSCQCNFCRPEVSFRTTHFLHRSCYLLFTYRRHMPLVKLPFLGGHPHAEYSRIKGSRVQFSNWSRNSLHVTEPELSSFPLSQQLATPGLIQFNPIHVPRSCLRCILIFLSPLRLGFPHVLTYFRFSTTKTLCALPYVPHACSFHSTRFY
jgi:hypothetical protein